MVELAPARSFACTREIEGELFSVRSVLREFRAQIEGVLERLLEHHNDIYVVHWS
ncbi:hypothetical protein BH24ACT24_BH24ACT24_00540 [soil metagenome]